MSKEPKKGAKDLQRRKKAFFDKIEEYSKLDLEGLKALYNHPDKKLRPGGIYRQALIEVVRRKQIETASKTITETVNEIKQETNT